MLQCFYEKTIKGFKMIEILLLIFVIFILFSFLTMKITLVRIFIFAGILFIYWYVTNVSV